MRKTLFLTAIASAASLMMTLSSASAQVGRFDPGIQSMAQTQGLTEVRFRRGGFHNHRRLGFGHGGYGRHRGGFGRFRGGYGRFPGGYGHRYGGGGLPVGAGIAGLAAGAIIGGAIASQAAPAYTSAGGNAVAYCSQKFKSYDPSSGTYLGYDGDRHSCP